MGADRFDISDKVALVSGASGALGKALSRGLVDAGAKVMLTGRSDDKLRPLADDLSRDGRSAAVEVAQPDDEEAVRRVVARSVEQFGGIDILVTAAGMNKPAPIVEQPLGDWEAILDSQLKTTWLFCKHAGAAMIDRGRGGKVILIGSQRGRLGFPNYSAYSPAKGAVHLLAQSLAWEWGKHGIQVNCLAPGLFKSELTEWLWHDDEARNRMLTRVPQGRLGEPEDFVGPLIFLASPASDWTTGAVLSVDGGYTAG
jgi:NAD(P)-dependent dehydrogenase (short-subunit alcohol dehydrogenase family)